MFLFRRTANKKYTSILTKGVTTPMNVIVAHEEDGVPIPHKSIPKDPSEYTDEEDEQLNLNISL